MGMDILAKSKAESSLSCDRDFTFILSFHAPLVIGSSHKGVLPWFYCLASVGSGSLEANGNCMEFMQRLYHLS